MCPNSEIESHIIYTKSNNKHIFLNPTAADFLETFNSAYTVMQTLNDIDHDIHLGDELISPSLVQNWFWRSELYGKVVLHYFLGILV